MSADKGPDEVYDEFRQAVTIRAHCRGHSGTASPP